MGYFDKTIEFILNTPIEELEKKMREYGVKFVENPRYKKSSSFRGKKGNTTEGYASSVLLKADKAATRKIAQAEEDIKAGRTRSLRDIFKDG